MNRTLQGDRQMFDRHTMTLILVLAVVGPITAWLYLKWADRRKRKDVVRRRLLRLHAAGGY